MNPTWQVSIEARSGDMMSAKFHHCTSESIGGSWYVPFHVRIVSLTIGLLLLATTLEIAAQDAPSTMPSVERAPSVEPATSFEPAARLLLESAVTVRVCDAAEAKRTFTGVSIKPGIFVSLFLPESTDKISVAFTGGRQIDAQPLVVDEYSGLCLLGIASDSLKDADKKLKPAPMRQLRRNAADPVVGSYLLGASPGSSGSMLVSLGIAAGLEQRMDNTGQSGIEFPGLIACDVRHCRLSRGAPIVDGSGNLSGIVVGQGADEDGGWTYALPTRHIDRLLRAYDGHLADVQTGDEERKFETLLLRRHRPKVGVQLNDRDGRVRVVRVDSDGPAMQAGIDEGDVILKVADVAISSVFEMIRPTLSRQPGDRLSLLIENSAGEILAKSVVLGGETKLKVVPLAAVSDLRLSQLIQPPFSERTSVSATNGKSLEKPAGRPGRQQKTPGSRRKTTLDRGKTNRQASPHEKPTPVD